MYKTIIWATDGSEGADVALQEALRLAKLSGGRIVATHCDQRQAGRATVWPPLPDEDGRRIKIRRQVAALRHDGVDIDIVIRHSHGEPADFVASIASEIDGDVIVCGTRGLGALSGAFLGSFTQRLLHVAPCPVLAVREPRAVEDAKAEDGTKLEVGA